MATLTNRFFQRLFHHQIVIALILVGLGSSVGCRNDAPTGNFGRDSAARLKVNAFQPKRIENATRTSSFFGKLKASRSQTLGFTVGGSLTTTPEAQQSFASGATMATLDSTQLVEQVNTLQQQLNASPSTGSPPASNNPLYRSPQDQLRDQIAELQNQIAQRTIKAPFDCIVQNTFAQQNSLVGANRPIVSVVETKTPKIEIFLPRGIVKQIQDDRNYLFVLDGKNIEAAVSKRAFIESSSGSMRTVFDIKTNLADFDFYLNQTVEARFSFPSEQSGYWLPLNCIQQASDGEWFVLAIDSADQQHTLRRQVVQIAQLRDDAVLVTDDLANQMIVRDGVHRVLPGQSVDLNLVQLEAVPEATATGVFESDPTDTDAADTVVTDTDATP